MIFYFSGRCAGEYKDIPAKPEFLYGSNANIMMSYRYARKEDLQRFLNIAKKRKDKHAS